MGPTLDLLNPNVNFNKIPRCAHSSLQTTGPVLLKPEVILSNPQLRKLSLPNGPSALVLRVLLLSLDPQGALILSLGQQHQPHVGAPVSNGNSQIPAQS